jgi:small subunit ribosomal protein S8
MSDTIADLLTRIRNAMAVKKPEIVLPYSRLRFEIAKLLETEKYIVKVEKIDREEQGPQYDQMRLVLKYRSNGTPAIRHIKRVSKPSRPVYVSSKEIPTILNGLGLAVISTSKGLVSNIQAKKEHIGGELMFEIW